MSISKLILVRYGQYQDGHLSHEGVVTMQAAADRIANHLVSIAPLIISAPTPRATESASIIGKKFGMIESRQCEEIYAADEDGLLPDCKIASDLVLNLGNEHSVIVAVASREYIETLPQYIFKNIFGIEGGFDTKLERGEALVVDFNKKKISFLR